MLFRNSFGKISRPTGVFVNAKKRLFFTILAAMAPSLVGCPPAQDMRHLVSHEIIQKDSCFNLLTYNIRVGAGRGGLLVPLTYLSSSENKLKSIVKAIESVDPDVIALQEVRGSAQAKFIADSLNLNYVYLSHGDRRLEWGLALLSKFNIIEHYGKPIRREKKNPRVCLVCTIDINNSHITVVNVHYYLGDYDKQVGETMTFFKDVAGPVILMGDLNLVDPGHGLSPIRKKLIDTCDAVDTQGSQEARQKGTFRFGSRRIDYIFVDPNYFVVTDCGLAPKAYRDASDHIAYFACVTLKK